MATIQKRGSGQWRVLIRRQGHPAQTRTFDTRVDAEAWARSVESEMDRGVFISRKEAETTTLAEALERFILEYTPRLAAGATDARRARKLQERKLARKMLAAIRGKDIADFVREREAEGMAANTIRLDLATLSRVFNLCRTAWGMESLGNPVQLAPRPKLPGGRQRRLEWGEEERLLDACPPGFRPVVLLALETAMRRAEIAGLTWTQVNLRKSCLWLPKTKNGDPRTVPLSPAALDLLRSLPRNLSGSAFGYTRDAITHAMAAACRKAGISDLTFHDLRHEATSRLFENTDLDIMEIKGITGHKTLQMLARYAHLRADRLVARLAGKKRGE